MRKIIGILCVMIVLSRTVIFAQTIEGKMAITGFPRDGVIKEVVPVDLFKSFKEGKYQVSFSYKAEGMGSRGIVLFDMKTTVKKDGTTIHTSTRKGWPWLPGDMYVPIEAFEVIPTLHSISNERSLSIKSRGNLPPGKYEISLEMVPTATWVADMEKELVPRGKIIPGYISFTVK